MIATTEFNLSPYVIRWEQTLRSCRAKVNSDSKMEDDPAVLRPIFNSIADVYLGLGNIPSQCQKEKYLEACEKLELLKRIAFHILLEDSHNVEFDEDFPRYTRHMLCSCPIMLCLLDEVCEILHKWREE